MLREAILQRLCIIYPSLNFQVPHHVRYKSIQHILQGHAPLLRVCIRVDLGRIGCFLESSGAGGEYSIMLDALVAKLSNCMRRRT